MRDGFDDGLLRDVAARKAQLRQLRRLLDEQEGRLLAALAADMGKPPVEAYAADIGFTIREISHVLKHLDRWVRPRSVRVPAVAGAPGRAHIQAGAARGSPRDRALELPGPAPARPGRRPRWPPATPWS